MEKKEVRRLISLELRKFRDLQAKQQGIESYKVLQNETIDLIAQSMPETNIELLDIKGIGPSKSKQYGPSILRIVKQGKEGERTQQQTPSKEDKIYSVGEFLEVLNRALAAKTVSVKGEITQLEKRGRNVYFSLKDEEDESVLNCFAREYAFPQEEVLEVGHEIVVIGFPNIYKPSGRFSLQVQEVLLSGEGLLRKAFEELKKKLQKEGLFDKDKKAEIPQFVQNIALITAKGSQAEKDFRKNIGEHGFSIAHIDVRVQGKNAVREITQALRWFNAHRQDTEVIALIRGGGSLEDLQAFNSEEVARAISVSKIPVVVGVGHEGDVSIADMVADKRVSTPTAVAETLSRDWKQADTLLMQVYRTITVSLQEQITHARHNLVRTGEKMTYTLQSEYSNVLNRLRNLYRGMYQGVRFSFDELRRIEVRFLSNTSLISRLISEHSRTFDERLKSLTLFTRGFTSHLSSHLKEMEKQLRAVSPDLKLKQGYSIAFGSDGKVIRKVGDVSSGEHITTRLSDGDIESEIV